MIKIQTTKLVNQNTVPQALGLFFSFLSDFPFIEHFSSIGRISVWPWKCNSLDNWHRISAITTNFPPVFRKRHRHASLIRRQQSTIIIGGSCFTTYRMFVILIISHCANIFLSPDNLTTSPAPLTPLTILKTAPAFYTGRDTGRPEVRNYMHNRQISD